MEDRGVIPSGALEERGVEGSALPTTDVQIPPLRGPPGPLRSE